jgi:hypothetical protein
MSAARLAIKDVHQPAVTDGSAKWLEFDHETLRSNFGHTPFKLRHNLVGHPLLTIPKLVELSTRLPENHVRFNSGEIPIGTRLYTARQTGLSAQETIRQIEQARSWMVLKYVEQDPAYAELMNSCLDEAQVLTEAIDPGMVRREAYVFITSPNSLTSWHMDPEHSFLLQARGSKTMYVQSNSIMNPHAWERYFDDGTVPPFRERYRDTARSYNLEAGDGLHVPVTVPHWVLNGPEVSISFSITFRTRAVERTAIVWGVNSYLRKKGLNPRPPGASVLRDSAKDSAFRALRRLRRLAGDEAATHSGKY